MDVGTYQLGYTAAQMALNLMKEIEISTRQIIPHRLVVRESSSGRKVIYTNIQTVLNKCN